MPFLKTHEINHWHVAVFHGPKDEYCDGLVAQKEGDHWYVNDDYEIIGSTERLSGSFEEPRDAILDALRLLREHYGERTRPCWGAGVANHVLEELGYKRPKQRWHWWPPRLELVFGECVFIGPGGRPAKGS